MFDPGTFHKCTPQTVSLTYRSPIRVYKFSNFFLLNSNEKVSWYRILKRIFFLSDLYEKLTSHSLGLLEFKSVEIFVISLFLTKI